MLTLLTTNPAKYEPFADRLNAWRIAIDTPRVGLPELQTVSFDESLSAKARVAAELLGRAVLVDDAGLVLEAYSPFPGPLTSPVLRSLGAVGLERLLKGVSNRARMECHIGCWVNGALRRWSGSVDGQLDFSRPVRHPRMLMTDLFVPASGGEGSHLLHRARALEALETGVFDLHLDLARPAEGACPSRPASQCPFCAELEGESVTVFSNMIGGRLDSRIVYEDDNFVLMPPIGEFMEGGLLLLTKRHILSFSQLDEALFEPLERLLAAVSLALRERWGSTPLIFEHGPAPDMGKGVCCVDHAHFNIFPAPVAIHPHLAGRMHRKMDRLHDMRRLRNAEFGYLWVQENDGTRHAYDGFEVPTQRVRRIVAAGIGKPDRWHWRDYPGYDELVTTYHALKGNIHP